MKKSILKFLAIATLLSTASFGAIVATELSLVIDVSGSISNTEFDLQMDGYGAAFRNAANQNLIINGGGIAVNYVFFASTASAGNNWTLLSNVASINAFALTLENVARPGTLGNQTGISAGMNSSRLSFVNNGFEGIRLVMDVSGDGVESVSTDAAVRAQRDAAFASGIIINGLPIGPASLATYYTNNVITSNGFSLPVSNFAGFTSAINQKLFRELGGEIPEPSTYAMMGLGLMGLAYFRRKR